MWALWLGDRGNGGMLAEQCTFTLVPNYVNLTSDVFTFTVALFVLVFGLNKFLNFLPMGGEMPDAVMNYLVSFYFH